RRCSSACCSATPRTRWRSRCCARSGPADEPRETAVTTSLFETEIREQPTVLERLVRDGRPAAEAVAAKLRGYDLRFAVLAARGTSDNAARYGQYLLGIRNQLVAALAAPSLFTQYQARPSLKGALVIGISQSGQSPDIVEVVREARRQGGCTLAITNDP